MSARPDRSTILDQIERGEITAEEGIALLAGAPAEAKTELRAESVDPAPAPDPADSPTGDVPTLPGRAQADPQPRALPEAVAEAPRSMSVEAGTESDPDGARWLRVRVKDGKTGNERVKLNLPMGLVEAGLRMFERLDPDGDWSDWRRSFQGGSPVKLVEVEGEDGEQVEISLD